MASSLITGAVAVILILISGYIIVGGILSISETVFYTQSEMTSLHQKYLNTKITILYTESDENSFLIGVANNGSTSFGGVDYDKMDLFIGYEDAPLEHRTLTSSDANSIINDRVNRKMWDESEIINLTRTTAPHKPVWVKLVTPNGVTASANL